MEFEYARGADTDDHINPKGGLLSTTIQVTNNWKARQLVHPLYISLDICTYLLELYLSDLVHCNCNKNARLRNSIFTMALIFLEIQVIPHLSSQKKMGPFYCLVFTITDTYY